jgi:hypothetical protein
MLPATNLALAPQSGPIDQFFSTVYYITLNSNCEAQRVSKKIMYFLKEKNMLKSHQRKSNHRFPRKTVVDTYGAPVFGPVKALF